MELIFKVDQDMYGVDCYIKKGELIRCKDCKYSDGDICIGFGDGHYVDKEGFCYCAERKEE